MRVEPTQAQLDAALNMLASNEAFQESAKLSMQGVAPHDMLRAMAVYPPLFEAMETLGRVVYPGGSLPRELKELVILQVSRANACQFCTASHIDIARGLGISEEPLDLLDRPEYLSEEFAAALEYTDAVRNDSTRIPEALFTRVSAHFDDAGIAELTFLVGYINMLNWFNSALQVEYRGELAPGS